MIRPPGPAGRIFLAGRGAVRKNADMADAENEGRYRLADGDSALLIQLPELAPHLKPWVDLWPHEGITTHSTVLVPFLREPELTDDVLAQLRAVFAGFAAFDLTLAKTARFPTVLYLVPEPAQPIHDMITTVYARWPQCPPYAGIYPDIAPHVSVVHDATEAEFEQAREILETRLPLRTRAEGVDLLIYDGNRWNLRERLPFADN